MSQILIQKKPAFPRTLLKKYTNIGVLLDEHTRKLCFPLLKKNLPPHAVMEVMAGEKHKNLTTCQRIWQALTENQFDRHSLLIIVGGGVLGDMGGFCAATFKRGIDFILVPTTLLSQVDASIGGKLGVDFGPYKNHIGTFQQPVATVIATDFLETLPERELRSGFAEVIKHCLIADARMWETIIKKPLARQNFLQLVRHSVNIKSAVTRKDPREKGLRKILNFGHTFGHAIEGHFLSTGQDLLHGEAVAAGMVLEAQVSSGKKMLSPKDLEGIRGYINSQFGKINLPGADALIPLMAQDKKNKGNIIQMALPAKIGKALWDVSVSEAEIRQAIEFYQSHT